MKPQTKTARWSTNATPSAWCKVTQQQAQPAHPQARQMPGLRSSQGRFVVCNYQAATLLNPSLSEQLITTSIAHNFKATHAGSSHCCQINRRRLQWMSKQACASPAVICGTRTRHVTGNQCSLRCHLSCQAVNATSGNHAQKACVRVRRHIICAPAQSPTIQQLQGTSQHTLQQPSQRHTHINCSITQAGTSPISKLAQLLTTSQQHVHQFGRLSC